MGEFRSSVTLARHDSPLGSWLHGSYRPRGGMAKALESIWYFDGRLTHRRERIFPDGLVELNVHFAEPHREVKGDASDAFPTVCVSGLVVRSTVIEAPGEATTVLGIRLHATAAAALPQGPLHDLTGVTADLHDVSGPAATALLEPCAEADGPEDRLRIAADWVRALAVAALESEDRRADSGPRGLNAAIAWVADRIGQCRGALPISGLVENLGWSRARFTTAFRERVGVAPKQLARICRFRHALELLRGGELRLADVALRAGYYDQPHFNAEFREFAGVTPRRYLAGIAYPGSSNIVG
jgi:AraC-like DNA-binding protein